MKCKCAWLGVAVTQVPYGFLYTSNWANYGSSPINPQHMELLFPIEAPVVRVLLLILGPAKTTGLGVGRRGSTPQLCPRSKLTRMAPLFTASRLPFSPCLGKGAEGRANNFTPPYSPHCAVCLAPPANMWMTLTWSYLCWLLCQRISNIPTPDCNCNMNREIPGVRRKLPLNRTECRVSETALKKSTLEMRFRCPADRTVPQVACILHSVHTTLSSADKPIPHTDRSFQVKSMRYLSRLGYNLPLHSHTFY